MTSLSNGKAMIGQTLGNYKIVAKLGNGAMGDVFLAEHQRIARRAAIKVLNQELTTKPQQVARFFDEARATSLIRHPGIVEVFDCDVDPQGRVYLVMEYLEGQTLAARLDKEHRLPWPTACALARQVARALGAAHEKGIVHRDIKPENIFLATSPARPTAAVKILDFGIAKLLAKDSDAGYQTVPGVLMGTPHYMPPEQCRGTEGLDRRADVYALGCVLFRMISGRLPFVGSQVQDVIAAQTFRPAPSLASVDPAVPRWLDTLVAQMLAKQPSDRPASMDEVARVLGRASGGWNAAGVLLRAGSFVGSRLAVVLGLDGPFRGSRRRVGLFAFFCAVVVGGGLWEARAILRPAPGKSDRASPGVSRRVVRPPAPPAPPVAPASPAAAKASAPLADLAAVDVAAPLVPVDAGPDRLSPTPPSPVVRRPALRAQSPARNPHPRRPTQALVEMDGLVDL